MDEPKLNEVISIFSRNYQSAEFVKSMRDFASLAGVLKALNTEKIYESPLEMIRFFNVIQLIQEATLKIGQPIADEQQLLVRYQLRFVQDEESPTERDIKKIVQILEDHHWLIRQRQQIKLLDRGRRLFDSLLRTGNDALAYYSQAELGRSLFQAKREAEMGVAYDDAGISGGQNYASMILHLEEATQQIELRQLELLADRNALPQLEKIAQLMQDLEWKLSERLKRCPDAALVARGYIALAKGKALSESLLTKYTRFIDMQQASIKETISKEKMRKFIIQMYTQEEPNTPNAHDVLSFMEQNIQDGEMLDGLWVPVKFAAPISALDIKDGLDYLQHYEPKLTEAPPKQPEPHYLEVELEERSIHDVLQAASWKATQALIDTEHIETYLTMQEVELEQLMTEAKSNKWHDAVLSLLAVSALTSGKRVVQTEMPETKTFDKQWEWIDDDDKRYTVRKYINDDE